MNPQVPSQKIGQPAEASQQFNKLSTGRTFADHIERQLAQPVQRQTD